MNESLRKILIYFRKWDRYWKLIDQREKTKVPLKYVERYPLDFKPRVLENHYQEFDKHGIPVRRTASRKKVIYRFTTMCSYALAQSDFYVLTGNSDHLRKLIKISDFLMEKGVEENDGILLREIDSSGEFKGKISAMIQGEAMSVLCRAFEFTGDERYLNFAIRLLPSFQREMEENGVVGIISYNNCKWYEEYPFYPLQHVLNGMIYSLWGLRDLSMASGLEDAEKLYTTGIEYVNKSLPLFDSGHWSYYRVAEKGNNYVSSMMYHNLHICQLRALFYQTGIESFRDYSDKFIKYTKNPVNRFRAAAAISVTKLQGSK